VQGFVVGDLVVAATQVLDESAPVGFHKSAAVADVRDWIQVVMTCVDTSALLDLQSSAVVEAIEGANRACQAKAVPAQPIASMSASSLTGHAY
jgi:hypothetical protein